MIGVIFFFALVYFIYYLVTDDEKRDATSRGLTSDGKTSYDTILPTIDSLQAAESAAMSPHDAISSTIESLNWCNDLLSSCWPYFGEMMEGTLAPTVEPLINQSLPKPFKEFRFLRKKLGKDPPKVDRISVHKLHHNSLAVDLDVEFVGIPDIEMSCKPLRGKFGIQEFRWKGRVSVLLRPLTTTMPLFDAVQIAMVDHPSMHINFTGVANFADLGPVSKVVRKTLKSVISSMLVLPNRMIMPVSPSVDFFEVYQSPLIVMEVTIRRGKGFSKEKKGLIKTLPDIYVKGEFGLVEFETKCDKNSQEPVWNMKKDCIVYDFDQPIHLIMMDKDLDKDDVLGEIKIPAKELLAKPAQWIRAQDNVDVQMAGKAEILLESKFFTLDRSNSPILGKRCMLSIVINRAINLPRSSSSTYCKIITENSVVGQTDAVIHLDDPPPGYNPINPVWNKSYDVILDNPQTAKVTLMVFNHKDMVGKTVIPVEDIKISHMRTKQEEFTLDTAGGRIRAKLILQALLEK